MEAEALKKEYTSKPVYLTPELIEEFLQHEEKIGKSRQTTLVYKNGVRSLYKYLGDDKEVTKDTLDEWAKYLFDHGYSDNTICTHLAGANALMAMLGRHDLAAKNKSRYLRSNEPATRATSKAEYGRMLAVAEKKRSKREYLLIKLFAMTGIRPYELDKVTREAVRNGVVTCSEGRAYKIPPRLASEILCYADDEGIKTGMLFITRTGNMVNRSNVTNKLRRIAEEAGVNMAKGTPRALGMLYVKTKQEAILELDDMYTNEVERLLNINFLKH